MCPVVLLLPLGPRLIVLVNLLTLFGGTGEGIVGEHLLGGNGDEHVIGDGEVSML